MATSSPENDASRRLDLRRSVILRWWLLAAVTIAVLSVPTFLDIPLPQMPMLAVLVLMAGFSAYVQWHTQKDDTTGASELFGQLCVDLTALAVLLYLSGGAANPLISFLLVPVAVAAMSLPGTLTAVIAFMAVAIYSILMWHFLPLPVADAGRAARLHLAGMWLTFVVSTTMIAWFITRMTASIRERDRRLAVTREQVLRDERVVALGAQAAGAAHELGTPLATMAVVVGELEREPGLDAAAREDLALVQEQIAVCKEIISSLAARAGSLRPEQLQAQDAAAWLQGVRARWHTMRPHATSRLSIEDGAVASSIATEATLEQAVVNLLNNAADAAESEINITLQADAGKLRILIEDGGSGFPAEVLRQAGRAPLQAKRGAGIGLFLAFSAVERLGGKIVLDNPAAGGGRATIELPLLPRIGT